MPIAHIRTYQNLFADCYQHTNDNDFWRSGTITTGSPLGTCDPVGKTFDLRLPSTAGIGAGTKYDITYSTAGTNPRRKTITGATPVGGLRAFAHEFSMSSSIMDVATRCTLLKPGIEKAHDGRLALELPKFNLELRLVLFKRFRLSFGGGSVSLETPEREGELETTGYERGIADSQFAPARPCDGAADEEYPAGAPLGRAS